MSLKKMKKTPTGWGTGYTNVDVVGCKKTSGTKIRCTLVGFGKQRSEKTLDGTDIIFRDARQATYSPGSFRGFANKRMGCYVDSGVIVCEPEKK